MCTVTEIWSAPARAWMRPSLALSGLGQQSILADPEAGPAGLLLQLLAWPLAYNKCQEMFSPRIIFVLIASQTEYGLA